MVNFSLHIKMLFLTHEKKNRVQDQSLWCPYIKKKKKQIVNHTFSCCWGCTVNFATFVPLVCYMGVMVRCQQNLPYIFHLEGACRLPLQLYSKSWLQSVYTVNHFKGKTYTCFSGKRYRLTGERGILKIQKMYTRWYHHSEKTTW